MYLDKESFKKDFENKLMLMFSESVEHASFNNKYMAFGTLIRDYMSKNWHNTGNQYFRDKNKQVYYFSLEFLIGKLLDANLINLGIRDVCHEGLAELGISLTELEDVEPDAGLGNGGLGRLAACFLDSMASMGIPGVGNGIRYKYGLFEQKIVNGYQIESPDNWLKVNNIWEIRRDHEACIVKFGGEVSMVWDDGSLKASHTGYEPILAVPYDMPIPGYDNNTVNTLRLWSAEVTGLDFDFSSFSRGDYEKASEQQHAAANITYVLYPDDSTEKGKLLRLKQEYFFTSAGVQSIVSNVKKMNGSAAFLDRYAAIQINDTHPAIAVAELMRILVDEEDFKWEDAWQITVLTFGYTNHTILAEALEKWDNNMFKKLLPRIYMIIEEINRRFCVELSQKYNNDWNKLRDMSIIQDGKVRMAYLAIVGSHSVNGVAALHTEILKNQELKNFNDFYPGKFNNKTNGITHRRWLIKANPGLTDLIDNTIGEKWKKEPLLLSGLKRYLKDNNFLNKVGVVKRENKINLSNLIYERYKISTDPDSIFDIQVKRLHMYKRQLLNLFNIMDLYNRLRENPALDIVPRTFIFAAKAFPGYLLAKNTIKLINTVADKVNNDPATGGKLKVVFMENYGVTLAEEMIPAGDISEQISTASKEASGTGNMKFMMNGAVTLATMDGANVEIYNEVGAENIVVFGLSSDEVIDYEKNGGYNSSEEIGKDIRISTIMDQIRNGYFNTVSQNEFEMIIRHLTVENDPYFTLKDFDAYVKAQNTVDKLYRNNNAWNRMAAANIACSGVFSSDNTIKKYTDEIWHAPAVNIIG